MIHDYDDDEDFLSLSSSKASFVGVMKKGINGICSQFASLRAADFVNYLNIRETSLATFDN